jgi:hypothetical protein
VWLSLVALTLYHVTVLLRRCLPPSGLIFSIAVCEHLVKKALFKIRNKTSKVKIASAYVTPDYIRRQPKKKQCKIQSLFCHEMLVFQPEKYDECIRNETNPSELPSCVRGCRAGSLGGGDFCSADTRCLVIPSILVSEMFLVITMDARMIFDSARSYSSKAVYREVRWCQ